MPSFRKTLNPRPSPNSMTERGPGGIGIGSFSPVEIEPSLAPPASHRSMTSSSPSTFTFEASAPRSLVHAYTALYETHRDAGKDHGDAHHRATREIQRRGWRKTKDGWRQVMPDLTDKINVTEGIEQPDGTYFIEGVPVFHPNAVKGVPFDADKIRQIIKNTNASIHAGGTKPGITEGHPNEMQGVIGKQLDTHGAAVNFRENPDKPGHTMCDLIDVAPEYFQRLKERKLPGLSAGFAKDCNDLNRRFGHVALLGGTSPALSHLPATEFFQSGNDLCFSADMEVFPKGKSMRSKKSKELFANVMSAQDAYDAAEMAKEAGDPTADAKMAESWAAVCKNTEAYAASMAADSGMNAGVDGMGGGPIGNTVQDESTQPTVGNGAAAGEYGTVPPMEMPTASTVSPQAPQMNFSARIQNIDFVEHPEEMFAAYNDEFVRLSREVEAAKQAREITQRAAKARELWMNFSSQVESCRREGRVGIPDAKLIREEFESFADSRDPVKAANIAIRRYKSLPAQRTPATINNREPIFAAPNDNGNEALTGLPLAARPRNKTEILQALGNGADDEELMFAAVGEAMEWDKPAPARRK